MIHRAISLHQPWATLVRLGVKTEETRGWFTDYRGPLLIQAAKTEQWLDAAVLGPAIMRVLDEHKLTLDRLPLGAFVCACRLADVVRAEDAQDAGTRPFGNYAPGRFAWLLQDVKPIEPPIAARGYQNFWTVEFDGRTVRIPPKEDLQQIKLL